MQCVFGVHLSVLYRDALVRTGTSSSADTTWTHYIIFLYIFFYNCCLRMLSYGYVWKLKNRKLTFVVPVRCTCYTYATHLGFKCIYVFVIMPVPNACGYIYTLCLLLILTDVHAIVIVIVIWMTYGIRYTMIYDTIWYMDHTMRIIEIHCNTIYICTHFVYIDCYVHAVWATCQLRFGYNIWPCMFDKIHIICYDKIWFNDTWNSWLISWRLLFINIVIFRL